jgi:outer membrane autotransporter protein
MAALSALAFLPATALGQDATWLAAPATNAFATGANWSTGTVPTGIATFGAAGTTSINVNGGQTLNAFAFTGGAPAYTFTMSADLTFIGAGIVNNSSNAPTIDTNGSFLTFNGASASAGNAIINNNLAFVFFQNGATAGTSTIANTGTITFTETSTAGGSNITITGGSTFLLSFTDDSSAGTANITVNSLNRAQFTSNASAGSAIISVNNGGDLRFSSTASADSARIIANTGSTVDLTGMATTLSIGSIEGGGNITLGANQVQVGGLNLSTSVSGVIDDSGLNGTLVKIGTGTLTLSGANTYTGGTTINGGAIAVSADTNLGSAAGGLTFGGGTLQTTASFATARTTTLNAGGGTFNTAAATTLTHTGAIGGTGGLIKTGTGTLVLLGNNNYSGGTTVSGGILQGNTQSLQGNILNNANVTFDQAGGGIYSGNMSGTGSLTKTGPGTLTLSGNNSYSGGTTVAAGGGILQGTTSSLQGNILNNATLSFNQAGSGTYGGVISGSGGVGIQGGGIVTFTGANTYSGATTVSASTLVVNGSVAGNVILNNGGILGGSGSVGGLASSGGTIAPGNSIGTLTVNGNFSQSGGTYVVEANAQGQSDRVNVSGTATINGATVQVVAAPGNYGTSTTYTILNAAGGVTGTYAGVSSNFAFLTPSLSYNANNVFLTLALQGNAFSGFGGNTVNQRAVGYALDQSFANATGDFATVISALASLNTQQGPYALNQISGQPYADFGTANLASNTLFMNALGQQMALARGGSGSGQRLALAQACEVEACDVTSPFSVWASGLGGFGSVQGDGNSNTFTYNLGGAAAGIDYRVLPSLLLGLGAGYTSGTQWTDTFQGKGWTNAVSVAAYGSFTMAGFYADLLAGYAYSNNQLQRQIFVPGLQPRTANGSTGANQFLGQAEIGYQVPVYAPAQASITPFARLQVMSVNQAAFSEWGANSLSLNVQQQTTNSLRSTLGAQLNGAIGLGDTRTLDMALRLGWLHEYAYTGRPVTAAFAGAPAAAFTVYGATPQRDAAAIGFQASTNVAAATQLYFRYDGDIGSGTDNHALNVGLRLSW